MKIRCEAMKAVVELDHSDKWAQAIQFPSRKAEVSLFLPGHHVMYWCARNTKVSKRRQTRVPARWHGPAVVIGHEWNEEHACF